MAASTVLSRPLPRPERQINVSSFAFLFAEMLSYHRERVTNLADLETKLSNAGFNVGSRFLELIAFRDKPGKRETTIVGMLQFICGVAWPHLFGKKADALEKSTDAPNSYMIRESEPLTSAFISMPKDMSRFNPGAFVAGIIRGMLDSAGFTTTQVKAVTEPTDGPRDKTVFLIQFEEGVAAREAGAS